MKHPRLETVFRERPSSNTAQPSFNISLNLPHAHFGWMESGTIYTTNAISNLFVANLWEDVKTASFTEWFAATLSTEVGSTTNEFSLPKFEDISLSPVEVEEIKTSREEREKGETKQFLDADEALAWLHSE